MNSNGQRVWQVSLGGTDEDDNLEFMIPTRDGGLLLAGGSNSGIGGTKTVPNLGQEDMWIVKLAPDALNTPPVLRSTDQSTAFLRTNGFRFTLSGVSHADYVIERSLDCVAWLPLTTNRLGSNEMCFVDPSATNLNAASYRARVVP